MTLPSDGSEVVVRFPGFGVQSLGDNADATYQADIEAGHDPPRYGVSVLADRCQDGETVEQTVDRICMTAKIGKRSKTVAVTSRLVLEAHDLVLVADPTADEPLHCLVGTATLTAMPDVGELESLLVVRHPNVAWIGRS